MPRRGLLPSFSTKYIKGSVPRFWSKGVEMTEKQAEVVCASEWWRGGDGGRDGEVVRIGDSGYNRLF